MVDAANVIGSRPDGWWRDRPAAGRRLVDALAAALESGRLDPPVVVVLEGATRAAAGAGAQLGIEVVHAPRDGDAAVAALAAEHGGEVTVVTADRALRARVEASGAATRGPSWLWGRLEEGGA